MMNIRGFFTGLLTACSLALFYGCEEPDYPDNVYDPDATGLPDPVLTSVAPPDSAFAGIGIITLTGENFSTSIEKNYVYFNGVLGTALTAVATELTVKAPNVEADSVMIKIAVSGSYQFAEQDNYKLYPPVIEYGGFDHFTNIHGLAMDTLENVYLSTEDREVLRIFSNGEQDSLDYGYHASFLKADAMRMGPEGILYLARRYKKLYTIPADGGNAQTGLTIPGNTRAYDLDFDQYGNLYTSGRNKPLYRVNILNGETDFSEVATYPEDVWVNAIRVFDGYVYIVGEYQGDDTTVVQEGIWRNQLIDEDSLGITELVIDWRSELGSEAPSINGITFSADGYMYIAAKSEYALYEIAPPYTGQAINPVYNEVLDPPASKITWGNSNYLYVYSRSNTDTKKRLYRIDMVKQGAPYYGRSF